MRARTVLITLAVLALACLSSELAWACPGCKDAIASQENGRNIAMGYQYSILFMMAMPFTCLGLFSAYMYWEIRRAQAAKDAERVASSTAEPARIQDG